ISCPGDADGQLPVVASPPAGETITSITWFRLNSDGTLGPPVATGAATQSNLPVGNYAVEIVTSNACSSFGLGTVVSPGEVFLDNFLANDPQCPGDANGSIFLTPGGGTPNGDGTYNYVWSTDPLAPPTTNSSFTNLRAGSYTVTITDANGCQPPFDTTFVLEDPPAIAGMFQLDPVSCPDDMVTDGQAVFIAEYEDGSAGTFDFTWLASNNQTSGATQSTETGLPRGPVSVRVSDMFCSETFTDTIRSPEEFMITLETERASCNGVADGSATVIITGGTPGYNYAWSVAPDIDSIVDGLAAGMNYTLDITDANGCSPGTQTFEITEPDPLTLSIDPAQTTPTVQCAGDANGRISVFISSINNNDLAANPYSWSGNVAGSTESVASDLTPGTYGVTV
ncbi:MAG: SprB repeat-containing protein, partial [Bacteroidota bacterium]